MAFQFGCKTYKFLFLELFHFFGNLRGGIIVEWENFRPEIPVCTAD